MSLLLAGTVAAAMFCSCAKNENVKTDSSEISEAVTDAADASGSQTVSLNIWCEESGIDTMNKMIESFKQKYAGEAEFDFTITVNADSATRDNVLADIHNAGDIITLPDDQLTALVAAGALEPVPNADEIIAANVPEAAEAAKINGVLYAYPMTADNGYFLYYDKRYISDSDAETLDGILAAAEKCGKKFTMEWTSGWYMYSFFGNTGLEFGLNDDGVTNYCSWNSTEGDIKGVDVAQALLDISASPAFELRADPDFPAGVKDGTIVAGVSGVWNAIEVKNAWGDDYGAAKLPTYTCNGKQIQMSSFTGYKMVGVNYYSEHKDWACKFAEWITNEENQTLRFVERNQGPSNKNAAASDEVMKVPAIQAVIAQSEFGKLQRVGNKFWEPFTAFGETMAQGNPAGTELQEIMDILVREITASTVN